MEKPMAYAFILIIVIFVAASTTYLWKNNFNKETLEVIFPAIGAILFSFYLGLKSVYIDAPEPETQRVTIVILHDAKSGKIETMTPDVISDMNSSPTAIKPTFRGLRFINMYPSHDLPYDYSKDPSLWQDLKKQPTLEDKAGPQIVLLKLLEVAILDWFTLPEQTAGLKENGTVWMFNAGSGTQSYALKLMPIRVNAGGDSDWNPFLRKRVIQINLPEGSIIERHPSKEENAFAIVIKTPHSSIEVNTRLQTLGVFAQGIDGVGKKIRKTFSFPEQTPNLWNYGFVVEIKTKQTLFSRFSNQAKEESIWLKRIREQFENDFSWDKLRSYYTKS